MTISPNEIRTKNRRKKHQQWWQDPRWKALVKTETDGKCCIECGKKRGDIRTNKQGKSHKIKLTLDHPDRWAYISLEVYLDPKTPKKVMCTDCNYMREKGYKICPECKEHYCHWTADMCPECYYKKNPGLKEQIEEAREKKKEELRQLQKKLRKELQLKYKRKNTAEE